MRIWPSDGGLSSALPWTRGVTIGVQGVAQVALCPLLTASESAHCGLSSTKDETTASGVAATWHTSMLPNVDSSLGVTPLLWLPSIVDTAEGNAGATTGGANEVEAAAMAMATATAETVPSLQAQCVMAQGAEINRPSGAIGVPGIDMGCLGPRDVTPCGVLTDAATCAAPRMGEATLMAAGSTADDGRTCWYGTAIGIRGLATGEEMKRCTATACATGSICATGVATCGEGAATAAICATGAAGAATLATCATGAT